jgi:hypothetical protein
VALSSENTLRGAAKTDAITALLEASKAKVEGETTVVESSLPKSALASTQWLIEADVLGERSQQWK